MSIDAMPIKSMTIQKSKLGFLRKRFEMILSIGYQLQIVIQIKK
jgi:hypothetical protein